MLMPNCLVRHVQFPTCSCRHCTYHLIGVPLVSSFRPPNYHENVDPHSILELREVTASKTRQDIVVSDFGRAIDEYFARRELDAVEMANVIDDGP